MRTVFLGIFLLFLICELSIVGCQNKEPAGSNKMSPDQRQEFIIKKKLHKLKHLTQNALKKMGANHADFEKFSHDYLEHILRVRVPGTIGHTEVREFIVSKLHEYGWSVEFDRFTANTPLGTKNFTNIVAKLNPAADRHLAIAAHYDSKLMAPVGGKYFLAATDSAVPCAMMLDFARLLGENARKLNHQLNEVSPMLLFLDGEEAFIKWGPKDSIYGSTHLAQVFVDTAHHTRPNITFAESLDGFVLLDLLGMRDPHFYDLYPDTSHMYKRLRLIENAMHLSGEIIHEYPYFVGKPNRQVYIEDDHVPFLRKGIPILHVISIPFPTVWHELTDDETAVDPQTVENLLKIFRQFFLEYFHLSS